MKKSIISLFIACLILVGCSSNENTEKKDNKNSMSCVLTADGYSVEYQLNYDKDKIMKSIEITSTQEVEAELTDEMISAAYDALKSDVSNIKGISIEVKATGVDKKKLSVTTKFDADVYDFEKDEAGVFGGQINMKGMNYKEVKEMIESFGATCS